VSWKLPSFTRWQQEAALAGRQDWQGCRECWLATRTSEVGSSDQSRV